MKFPLAVLALVGLLQGCVAVHESELSSAVDGIDEPDVIVLRVRVTSVEATEWSRDCPEETNAKDGRICIPMYFWFKYKAKVLDTTRGQWQGNTVEFANYQHAQYVRRLTDDCYVVLTKASPTFAERLKIPYVSEDIVFTRSGSDRARLQTLLHGT